MALSVMSGNSVALETPLKFGHRQANMAHEPGPSVFELANRIQGLRGIELQVIWKGQDLGDRQTALSYKKMAHDWGLQVPSIAGIWAAGQTIFQTEVARRVLERAIRAADLLGASVILVALFDKNCPRMDDSNSYADPVTLLQQAAPMASDAGIVLEMDGNLCRRAVVTMGAASPVVRRSPEAETVLTGKTITPELARAAGHASMHGAMPLSMNVYKVQLFPVAIYRTVLLAAGQMGLDPSAAS